MTESRWFTPAVAAAAAVAYSLWISFERPHFWVGPKAAGILVGFVVGAILGYPFVVGLANVASALSREFGGLPTIIALVVGGFFAFSFMVLFILNALWDWETDPVKAGTSLAAVVTLGVALVSCGLSIRGVNPGRWFSWRAELGIIATAAATAFWYLVRESSRVDWRADFRSVAVHIMCAVLFAVSAAAAAYLVETLLDGEVVA